MINYKVRIDLEGEREICENIVFTTGDKSGYRLDFLFYSNGKRIDTSLCGLTVKAKRADGAVIIDSGVTTKDETYYIVADNAYSVKGELEFEVALVKADGSYATTKVISAQVREGFGEIGLSSADNEPVLAKLEGQYLECRSENNIMSKEIAENTEAINNNAEEFNAHTLGEKYKHDAKDITYSGNYYEDEQNVEDAINFLGTEVDRYDRLIAGNLKTIQKNETDITKNASDIRSLDTQVGANTVGISENSAAISEVDERLSNSLTGLEGRIDNNDSDIQTLKDTSDTHTTNINNIIYDLAARPTAEWAEEVATDLGDKETRVSSLEEQVRENLPELDAQIQGNKVSIEILGITLGDIDSALDSIIAIQNSLIGGVSV